MYVYVLIFFLAFSNCALIANGSQTNKKMQQTPSVHVDPEIEKFENDLMRHIIESISDDINHEYRKQLRHFKKYIKMDIKEIYSEETNDE